VLIWAATFCLGPGAKRLAAEPSCWRFGMNQRQHQRPGRYFRRFGMRCLAGAVGSGPSRTLVLRVSGRGRSADGGRLLPWKRLCGDCRLNPDPAPDQSFRSPLSGLARPTLLAEGLANQIAGVAEWHLVRWFLTAGWLLIHSPRCSMTPVGALTNPPIPGPLGLSGPAG